jgi:hypothetical protein
MKAYILSTENGTVQIGDTVFQPITHKKFKADRKGLNKLDFVEVNDKSFKSARLALRLMNRGMLPDGGPTRKNFKNEQVKIAQDIDRQKKEFDDFALNH